jgi:hypothetical protein
MTHAWILTVNHPDGRPPVAGLTDGYLLDEIGRSRITVLSLGSPPGSGGAVGGTVVRDERYEVLHDVSGGSAGARPVAAAVLDFDGPISPAMFAAAERAFTGRLQPLLEAFPGCVRVLALHRPETGAQVVVNLTDSLEALGAVERAINTSQLLPGEDPALLPGPDRVSIQNVATIFEGAMR